MLNEQALKMVGPSFEEVGVKTSGDVNPATTPTVVSLTIAYSPVAVTSVLVTRSK